MCVLSDVSPSAGSTKSREIMRSSTSCRLDPHSDASKPARRESAGVDGSGQRGVIVDMRMMPTQTAGAGLGLIPFVPPPP